ncbi:MAG: DUF1853 family protein, partial [Owenweeksia sp.]
SAESLKQKLHLTGSLFVPYQNPDITLPDNINPQAVAGYWVSAKHFTEAEFGNHLFTIVPKENWLLSPATNEKWNSFTTTCGKIRSLHYEQRSPMLWVKKPDGNRIRLFVVWWE